MNMRHLALFSSLLVCPLLTACPDDPRVADIVELSPDVVNGASLYEANCLDCHGADLSGGEGGPDLIGALAEHDDADIADTILKGGLGMPSFSDLSDQEVADVVGYMRTVE
jgi:mono/diheme cytochrome c family protein